MSGVEPNHVCLFSCSDIHRYIQTSLTLAVLSGPQPLANIVWHKGGFIGGALKKYELGLVQAKLYFKLKYY